MSKDKEEQLKLVVGSKKKNNNNNTAGIPISESGTNQSHVKSPFFDL